MTNQPEPQEPGVVNMNVTGPRVSDPVDVSLGPVNYIEPPHEGEIVGTMRLADPKEGNIK